MKSITFTIEFVLTVCLIIAGVVFYPNILGQAATANNQFVFTLFIVPFCGVLLLAWTCEKIFIRLFKRKEGTAIVPLHISYI